MRVLNYPSVNTYVYSNQQNNKPAFDATSDKNLKKWLGTTLKEVSPGTHQNLGYFGTDGLTEPQKGMVIEAYKALLQLPKLLKFYGPVFKDMAEGNKFKLPD